MIFFLYYNLVNTIFLTMSSLEKTFLETVKERQDKVDKGMPITVTEGPRPSHGDYTEHKAAVLFASEPFEGKLDKLVASICNIKQIVDYTVESWDNEQKEKKVVTTSDYEKNFAVLSSHKVCNPLHSDPVYCIKGASFVLVVPDNVDEKGVVGVVDVKKYSALIKSKCQYNFVFVHKDVRVEDKPRAFLKNCINVVFYLK